MGLFRSLWALGGPSAACPLMPGCQWLSPALCSPVLWLLQIQSCLTMIGLGLAWLWASQSRVRETRRIRAAQMAGNPLAFVNSDVSTLSHEKQRQLSKVSVILAVKGSGEQSLANWRSQLVTLYGGQLEYIFCVESKDDPAYEAVKMLQKEMQGVSNVRLVVAGLATSCSQQIHNQMAGAQAAAADSKFLLFLDDDIQVHPGTIGSLVDALEQRPEVFVCTGYSFDVPSAPSLAAYAAMCYRLPLLVGMSSGGPCFFVWGGCIMIRTADLRTNRHGVQAALKKNGYSNDLILTAIAGMNKRAVWCPAVALFPGRMSGEWTFTRYWNYVRRQIFALLTYCNSFAYRTNRTGWVIYSYLAFAAILPLPASLLHVSYSLGILAKNTLLALSVQDGGLGPALASVFSLSAVARQSICPIGLGLAWGEVVCLCFATLMCVRMFFAAITLCNLLSPEKKPLDLGKLSIWYGLGGMLLNLTCLPVIALYTWLRKDITWAGIRYVRRHGIVAKVEHPHQQRNATAAAAVPILGTISGKGQELVALEGQESGEQQVEGVVCLSVSLSHGVGTKVGPVESGFAPYKADVEAQLVQGEGVSKGDVKSVGVGDGNDDGDDVHDDEEDVYVSDEEWRPSSGAYGTWGHLEQLGSWLKARTVLNRLFSPGSKKTG